MVGRTSILHQGQFSSFALVFCDDCIQWTRLAALQHLPYMTAFSGVREPEIKEAAPFSKFSLRNLMVAEKYV